MRKHTCILWHDSESFVFLLLPLVVMKLQSRTKLQSRGRDLSLATSNVTYNTYVLSMVYVAQISRLHFAFQKGKHDLKALCIRLVILKHEASKMNR